MTATMPTTIDFFVRDFQSTSCFFVVLTFCGNGLNHLGQPLLVRHASSVASFVGNVFHDTLTHVGVSQLSHQRIHLILFGHTFELWRCSRHSSSQDLPSCDLDIRNKPAGPKAARTAVE